MSTSSLMGVLCFWSVCCWILLFPGEWDGVLLFGRAFIEFQEEGVKVRKESINGVNCCVACSGLGRTAVNQPKTWPAVSYTHLDVYKRQLLCSDVK